jgi:ABC-type polar amino acid transport system ATPase subunit
VTSEVAIQVHGLHKRFGDDEVLKSIDLTVHRGEIVVIMGRSGAGKTTFLRCLNLLEKPDAGTITIHDRTVGCSRQRGGRHRDRLVRDLRTRTAMVFQHSALDPELAAEVAPIIKDLAARGITVVIVAHDLAFAREVAHRVLFMEAGYLLDEQPPRTHCGS